MNELKSLIDGAFVPSETVGLITGVCRDFIGQLLNRDEKSVAVFSSLLAVALSWLKPSIAFSLLRMRQLEI